VKEALSPPEAERGRTAAFVFGAIGVVEMLISLFVSDNNKDLRGLIMVIATFSGPIIALFGTLIGTIAALRAKPVTSGHKAALALNVVLMAGWLWRWSVLMSGLPH
jgi:hypothetical protein